MTLVAEEIRLNTRIRPCSAHAFELRKGEQLIVVDPQGEQVSDLVAFSGEDRREVLSSGRTLDYLGKLWPMPGDLLYSNRSRPMFTLLEDTCGRHDFMLAPCSREMFEKTYGEPQGRPGCEGNLAKVLDKYGVEKDQIPVAFNIFMHVSVDPISGALKVLPPLSKPGDFVRLRAEMDMIVGLTACSAGQSNNFSYKPIDFRIEPPA